MTTWTQPERHCLLSALQIVEQIKSETYELFHSIVISCSIILKCLIHKYEKEQQHLTYITEAIGDQIME